MRRIYRCELVKALFDTNVGPGFFLIRTSFYRCTFMGEKLLVIIRGLLNLWGPTRPKHS